MRKYKTFVYYSFMQTLNRSSVPFNNNSNNY